MWECVGSRRAHALPRVRLTPSAPDANVGGPPNTIRIPATPEARLRPRRIRSLPAVLLLALAACGGNATTQPAPGPAPAPMPPTAAGPTEAVERFLNLAAARNYMGMGQLFGTVDGPITNR